MLVRMGSDRNSHSVLVGMQNDTATLENVRQFLTKLIIFLLRDPVITLLAIYPNELKAYVHIKICT